MIVSMEKITVLVFHKAKESFLSSLQNLGVLHISQEKKEISDEVLRNMQKRIERARAFLNAEEKAAKEKQPPENFKSAPELAEKQPADPFSYIASYEAVKDEISNIENRFEKLDREIRNLTPWGDFDINSIKKLTQIGVRIRFFIVPLKKFKACVNEDICYQKISEDRTYVYFVVFEKKRRVQLDCDEFFYPDTDKKKLEADYADLLALKAKKELTRYKIFAQVLEVREYLKAQETEFAYLSISNSLPSAAEESVYIVNGWLPRTLKNKVESFLQKEEVYFYFSAPQVGESVPVLLKNNRFSRLFEPITKLFALPQYGEMDLTAFFAPFFTLFFGFCLGDAGYGLVIFSIAIYLRKKLSVDKKPLMSLLMVLGGSTFLFGLISGNLFGVDISRVQGIKKIVLFNQDALFNVALILGVIQVLFGMFLKAINRMRQFGVLASFSTFGWIIMLLGLLGLTISRGSIWAVYTGLGLILLFNDLKANIFVRIGKGLWELYGITGIFGDVLSYIRLFALGISSSILGFVVNDIAFQFRGIPFIGFFITFIILIVGHTGNMLLSALSSFVHPLRLTFVEFYKSAGFEGGGKAYNPFRRIR